MQVGILTNVNSRKNLAHPRREDDLRALVGTDGLVRQTRSLDEIRPVLEEFKQRGVRYWVSDGGDGTLHWMINEGRELLADATGALPCVVPTNGGTIDFVAKKAGISGNADSVIGDLLDGVRRGMQFPMQALDTFEVTGRRPSDPPGTMPFRKLGFAIAVGGLGQRFFSKYYEDRNPGPWAIIRVILKTAAGYPFAWGPLRHLPGVPDVLRDHGRVVLSGTRARVTVDGRDYPYELFQGLHAASVDIDFGTVKLFTYAKQPRKLHLVVGAMDRLECVAKSIFLVFGKPIPGKTWHEFPGEEMDIEARGDELLAPVIDGELFEGFERLHVVLGPTLQVVKLAKPKRGAR